MKLETGRILRSLLRKQPTFRDHWFPPETSGGRRGMSAVLRAKFYGTGIMPCKFRARFSFVHFFLPFKFLSRLYSRIFSRLFSRLFFSTFIPTFVPTLF